MKKLRLRIITLTYFHFTCIRLTVALMIKCTNVTVVRAVASHQCGSGLRLTLVLSVAPRGFSPGTLVFPSPQKPTFTIPTRNDRKRTTMWMCYISIFSIIHLSIYLLYLWSIKRCRFECTISVTSHPSYLYSNSTRRWKKVKPKFFVIFR